MFLSISHVSVARACVPVYGKAMLVAFFFRVNNTHLTLELEGVAVPLSSRVTQHLRVAL